MMLQTLQHMLSQLLAPARPDARTAPIAVTGNGRTVSIGATHVARLIPEVNGQPDDPSTGITGKVRRSHPYGDRAYGIAMMWLGRCAAVMTDNFGPTTATSGAAEFGPAETSQPSRSAKT